MTEKRFADIGVRLWRAHKAYERQARVVRKHANRTARLREELKTLRTLERQLEKVLLEFNEVFEG